MSYIYYSFFEGLDRLNRAKNILFAYYKNHNRNVDIEKKFEELKKIDPTGNIPLRPFDKEKFLYMRFLVNQEVNGIKVDRKDLEKFHLHRVNIELKYGRVNIDNISYEDLKNMLDGIEKDKSNNLKKFNENIIVVESNSKFRIIIPLNFEACKFYGSDELIRERIITQPMWLITKDKSVWEKHYDLAFEKKMAIIYFIRFFDESVEERFRAICCFMYTNFLDIYKEEYENFIRNYRNLIDNLKREEGLTDQFGEKIKLDRDVDYVFEDFLYDFDKGRTFLEVYDKYNKLVTISDVEYKTKQTGFNVEMLDIDFSDIKFSK